MIATSLSAEDDLRHAHGDDPHWNESFYFNFFDADRGLGGFTRIGFSPSRGVVDMVLCVYRPSGGVLVVRRVAPFSALSERRSLVEVGPLRFECVEPLHRWRLFFAGDAFSISDPAVVLALTRHGLVDVARAGLAIDLEFTALHPVYVFPKLPQRRMSLGESLGARRSFGDIVARARRVPARLASAVKMRDNHHFEQAGRVRGLVAIDGERVSIDGTGMRDRSWGLRDWTVPTRWWWINTQFGDDLAFNAFRIHLFGYDAWGGYVWNNGRLSTLGDWKRHERQDGTALLTLPAEDGAVHEVIVERLMPVPFSISEPGFDTVLDEAIARFRWNGRASLGIDEKMERVFP
ncbi:MAG: hypothetical protein U0269_10065 [Polyangiales bacterium]